MELVAKLGIDWKLFLAQVFNFLILAFILYKMVYKPALEMLANREQKIEDIEEMRAASVKKTKEESLLILEEAGKKAEELRQSILKKANDEVLELQNRAKLAIEQEREKMLKEVSNEVVELSLLTTERILQREFSPADQKRVLEELVRSARRS
jgi:F-type H+-transporting ATPase subunit b